MVVFVWHAQEAWHIQNITPQMKYTFLIWTRKHCYAFSFQYKHLHDQAVWNARTHARTHTHTHTHTHTAFDYPALNVLHTEHPLEKVNDRYSLLRRWSMFLSATHWKKQRFTCLILDMKLPAPLQKASPLDAGTDSIHPFAIRNKQTNKKLFDLSQTRDVQLISKLQILSFSAHFFLPLGQSFTLLSPCPLLKVVMAAESLQLFRFVSHERGEGRRKILFRQLRASISATEWEARPKNSRRVR